MDVASEIEESRYKMLVNNLTEFELYNVMPVNEDSLKLCKRLNFIDIMYFDPPWGGAKYKYVNDLRLKINNVYMDELVNIIFNKDSMIKNVIRSEVKMIVLKLPKNYDLHLLYENTKHNNITMILYELCKMFIVIFKLNDF